MKQHLSRGVIHGNIQINCKIQQNWQTQLRLKVEVETNFSWRELLRRKGEDIFYVSTSWDQSKMQWSVMISFSCPEQPKRWPCHSVTDWIRTLLLYIQRPVTFQTFDQSDEETRADQHVEFFWIFFYNFDNVWKNFTI